MQLKNLVKSLFVSFTLLSTSAAFAAVEDDIKKNTENFVGEKVKSVVKTNYGDLYEVFLQGGDLIYTDKNNSFYFHFEQYQSFYNLMDLNNDFYLSILQSIYFQFHLHTYQIFF